MDYKKEVEEALFALQKARDTLNKALKKLNTASGWGLWDLLGGGFLSSIFKFDNMDKAEELIEELNRDLENLRKELKDINLNLVDFESVSEFGKTFDMFFDNIFSDWSTQSKIDANISKLEELDRYLDTLEVGLKEKLEKI
ncbi:MAG: hypothetical protein ACTJGH_04950 [Peptoniphilaceae bacterium]